MSLKSIISSLKNSLTVSDHVSATVIRDDKVVGFTESQGRGRAANGDIDSEGNVSFGIRGNSSQGEDGTLKTCQILISALNKDYDYAWGDPYLVERLHIDAEAKSNEDQSVLSIQVVRAITDQGLWEELGTTRKVKRNNLSQKDAAHYLKDAIEIKIRKIDDDCRNGITLAINSLDTPAICFDDVVSAFKSIYGSWATSLGFSSIWLVGPRTRMVYSLTMEKGVRALFL